MADFRMKNYQTVLINRLAHQVKNDLTTMRLALFNLNYVLDAENSRNLKKQAADFLHVLRSSLDKSIETLSKILIATRTGDNHFESINVIRVLFEAITQNSAHNIIKVDINKKELLCRSDAQSLQLFFDILINMLNRALSKKEMMISVQLTDNGQKGLKFVGNFNKSDIFAFLQNDETVLAKKNPVLIPMLLLMQLSDYLHIEIEWNQLDNELREVEVRFNQQNGELQ